MAKVKFSTVSCSANGIFQPGQVAEVPEEFAKQLIDGGFAERADAPEKKPDAEKAQAPAAKSEKAKTDGGKEKR